MSTNPLRHLSACKQPRRLTTLLAAGLNGNAYMTGDFTRTAAFDAILLTADSFGDILVAKIELPQKSCWRPRAASTGRTLQQQGPGLKRRKRI
jgi:hypothetical protein